MRILVHIFNDSVTSLLRIALRTEALRTEALRIETRAGDPHSSRVMSHWLFSMSERYFREVCARIRLNDDRKNTPRV